MNDEYRKNNIKDNSFTREEVIKKTVTKRQGGDAATHFFSSTVYFL